MSSKDSWRTAHNGPLRPNALSWLHPPGSRVVKRGLNSAEAMEYLGMRRVAPIHSVGAESKHAHRKRAHTADHSSTAHGVDVEALIAEVDHPCHERCPA